jgi:hypothetical protein
MNIASVKAFGEIRANQPFRISGSSTSEKDISSRRYIEFRY